MARLVQFLVSITSQDRRRRRHVAERGRILQFIVQYETIVEGRWLPVVRYDTAHGYAHKHVFHPDDREDIIRMQTQDYNKALSIAEEDVRNNWLNYKVTFLKEAEVNESE